MLIGFVFCIDGVVVYWFVVGNFMVYVCGLMVSSLVFIWVELVELFEVDDFVVVGDYFLWCRFVSCWVFEMIVVG